MKNFIALFCLFSATLWQLRGQDELAAIGSDISLEVAPTLIRSKVQGPQTFVSLEESVRDYDKKPKSGIELEVSPDFTENLEFTIKVYETEVVEIRLFDNEGRQIKNFQTATKMTPGKERYQSNSERFKTGKYFLVIYTSNETIARELTKV